MSDSISVTNQCYDCMLSDSLCSECLDNQEARASMLAHQMVDGRADIYRYSPMYTPLMKVEPYPSNHDWVSPVTRGTDGKERHEFYQATTYLADRLAQSWFLGKHIFDMTVEDDELKFSDNYQVCDSCYLLVNRGVSCPNCM